MHEGEPSQAMRVRALERTGAFQRALSWPVARRSLTIAVIIGSVLNLINQGDTLFAGGSIDWLKAALTYCVPFCDLKKFDVPMLIMRGDDDQIVPIGASAMLSAKLVKKATLKIYKGLPHGMCTTHADQINADLLAFIKR